MVMEKITDSFMREYQNKEKHQLRIVLRLYNDWLLRNQYADTDIVYELSDKDLDEFISKLDL